RNPGWRAFQRLNRAEYARAVHDLLGIDVDVNAFLPPDTISGGFDNVSDVQAFSPTLMEGYLRAASQISRLAVGDRNATPTSVTYKIGRTASQTRHVDGAPMGTRGGISVVHVFPADGDYVIKMSMHNAPLENTLADVNISFGVTSMPHMRDMTILGPNNVTGVSETASRRKIFTCRPTTASEEQSCAAEIVEKLISRAYRGVTNDSDLRDAMNFYAQGRQKGDFE